MMPAFHIRVDGGKEQVFETRSGIYMHAAMAVPAMLDIHTPVVVEIWVPNLLPEYGPHFYRVEEDEFGGVRVRHLVRVNG